MSIYEYPAILKYEDDCCYVRFPDIENCFTDGDTREEAIDMACDVLPLMLCDYEDRHLDIPKPSRLESIAAAPNEEVVLIKANTTLYRKSLLEAKAASKPRRRSTAGTQGIEAPITGNALKKIAE